MSRDTTPTDVEKAYRRKCLRWHPDKWQTHSPEEQKKAEDTFKEIGLCRDILRSTVTRAIYDDMVRNLSDSSSDEGPWVRTTTFRGTPFSGKGPQSAWTSPPPKPKPSTSSSSSSTAAGRPTTRLWGLCRRHRSLQEMGPFRQSHLPIRQYRMCFRCRKIAYRGGIGADKDWCDACGDGSCGSGDAWVAKARRCAPQRTTPLAGPGPRTQSRRLLRLGH